MINLLPPEYKLRHRYNSLVYGLLASYIGVVVVLGVGLAILGTVSFSQQISLNDKQTQLADLNSRQQKASAITQKAGLIEDRLADASKYAEKRDWSSLVNDIAGSTPTAVRLTNLQVDATQNTVVISGQANDRLDVVLFRDKLATLKSLTNTSLQQLDSGASGFVFTINATLTNQK